MCVMLVVYLVLVECLVLVVCPVVLHDVYPPCRLHGHGQVCCCARYE